MSTLNRDEIVKKLNSAVQLAGNQNVLFTNAIANRVGLSATEFECCSVVDDHGPLTAGELASRCGITTGGMTGMIDRLEKMDFVERDRDPNDRRRVMVKMKRSEETIAKIRHLYAPLQKSFNKVLADYSDAQLALILDYYQKMNVVMQEKTDELSKTKM